MPGTKLSLITVTYNSAEVLREYWAQDLGSDIEWIVVDNASSDGSADVARELGADRVVELPRNVGFSAANNVGAALAVGDALGFMNPDVRVVPASAIEMADHALRDGIVIAPQLLNLDGTPQENGRQAPYLARKLLHFIGRDRRYSVIVEDGRYQEVAWVIGAALIVPAEVFRAIRGWDSSFFIYYEDSDFCLRARAAGYTVVVAGGARWTHGWARATRRSINLQSWRHEFDSAFTFYRRYPALLLPPPLGRLLRGTASQDVAPKELSASH